MLVLLEFEESSYKEIARITVLPLVVFSLACGSKRLQLALTNHKYTEGLS